MWAVEFATGCKNFLPFLRVKGRISGFPPSLSLHLMILLPLRSSSFCLTRIAVATIAPRNLSLKPSIMVGSARLLSSSSNKKRVFEEHQEVESSQVIKFETSGDLQAMTIQQLRTMSKKVGISARGSKHDLVSALKCFVDNGKDGHSSPVTSETGTNDLKNMTSTSDAIKSSGKKAKQLTSGDKAENLNIVAEVLTVRQRKTRGKPPTDDSANFVVDSENLKTNKVSDTQPSLTKRKRSSHVEKEDGASTERIEFVESSSEPWTILAHKKPQKGWIPYNPKTMRPPPLDEGTKFMKLISWNVNGLRALLKLDSFSTFAQREDFDILCLQETKLQEKDVEKIKERLLDGYDNSFWTCSVSKLGYSGTAIISRVKPISVRYGLGILDHDSEGRLVTLEFDTFYLISGYVPNSGDGLKRLTYRVTQWDPSLANYMKELESSKPVILTGDLNCAHQEIDIFNPAGNKRSAGFTAEERESFETNFLSKGFVDTFRRQHPGVVGYTYWGFRHGGRVDNKGWRLDYFLVSESIADKVHDSYIIPDVMGSDHCPIGLILRV